MPTETDEGKQGTKEESRDRKEGSDDRSSEKNKEDDSSKDKKDDSSKKEEDSEGSDDKEKKPKKKKSWVPFIILGIVLVLGVIAGVIYYLHARNYESTDDAFVDGHVVQVSPQVGGKVIKVYFDDNAVVKKGDSLIDIDPRPLQVALEKAKAQLAQTLAQGKQQGAQTEIAGVNYQRSSGLYSKDARAVSKEQVDTNKANLDAAQSSLDAAKASAQAAEAAVHDAELQLSYTKIHAVSDGKIARKQVEPGNYVQPGQTLCSLVMPDIWVTANFKETQLTKMLVGQPVAIQVDSFPDRDLRGHIDSFQPGTGSRFSLLPPENATGNYVKVVQRLPVKIVFDESEQDLQRLAPGQSVVPKVNISVDPQHRRRPPEGQ